MEEQKNEDRIKCVRCHVKLLPSNFSIKRDGVLLKACNKCREVSRKFRERNRCEHGRIRSTCKECGGGSLCEHGRRRSQCKECGGVSICEHGRQRSQCKECGGVSICEHGRIRSQCKECGGASICEHNKERSKCKLCTDPVKITINNWIKSSRASDKKYKRYDADHFIDRCFLKGLVEDNPNCYYCKIELQYIVYNDDLSTIERLDNSIGHIKSNCVLACKKCNISRVGDSL
jgi:hypothetical protein